MHYDRSIIPAIEDSLGRTPFCGACGARVVVRSQDDRIILECANATRPMGLVARLLAALVPHERVVVVS